MWGDRQVGVGARRALVTPGRLVIILGLAISMTACDGGDPLVSSAALSSAAPTAAATSTSGGPTTVAPATPSSAPSVAVGTPALQVIVVDAGLLGILPASVDGIDMQAAPDTAARMIADPSLARSASAVAVGLVAAAGNSSGDDLAISSVIQLRPGVFDDDFYARWRADYDEAACAQAGGIASHVQQQIGAHAVEVTVCSGGARTYHTHLAGDILVSITAVGDRTLGERVMAGLRR